MSESRVWCYGWTGLVCTGAAILWQAPWFLLSAFCAIGAMFAALDDHRGEPSG